jgi:hypothetical protein
LAGNGGVTAVAAKVPQEVIGFVDLFGGKRPLPQTPHKLLITNYQNSQ